MKYTRTIFSQGSLMCLSIVTSLLCSHVGSQCLPDHRSSSNSTYKMWWPYMEDILHKVFQINPILSIHQLTSILMVHSTRSSDYCRFTWKDTFHHKMYLDHTVPNGPCGMVLISSLILDSRMKFISWYIIVYHRFSINVTFVQFEMDEGGPKCLHTALTIMVGVIFYFHLACAHTHAHTHTHTRTHTHTHT